MSVFKWLTGRMTVTSGYEKWRWFFGTDEGDSGETVNAVTALKLSAWWACVRLYSETIATLPGAIVEKKGDERAILNEHPLYELLMISPNGFQTPVEFWEGRVAPICMQGNSYAEKSFIGERLVALQPLKAPDVTVYRTDSGQLGYRHNDRGRTREIPVNRMFHIKGFGLDEDEGLSPISFASRSIGGALAADRAAARVYGKGMRASGFWKAPVEMDKDQRQQFFDNYIQPSHGAAAQGQSPVLPPGFEWINANISSKDAELLLTRGFNVEDVCRWMGVPPILVGHAAAGQTMWGSGVEQIILGWLALGLRGYLRRIEAAVNMHLVPVKDRGRIKFEFNIEGLLRADSAARAQLASTLAQNGLRTRNELRKLDNEPPMPGGDELTVQSNLVPIEKLGELGGQPTVADNPKDKTGKDVPAKQERIAA